MQPARCIADTWLCTVLLRPDAVGTDTSCGSTERLFDATRAPRFVHSPLACGWFYLCSARAIPPHRQRCGVPGCRCSLPAPPTARSTCSGWYRHLTASSNHVHSVHAIKCPTGCLVQSQSHHRAWCLPGGRLSQCARLRTVRVGRGLSARLSLHCQVSLGFWHSRRMSSSLSLL